MNLNILMSVFSAGFEFLFLYVFKWGIWGAAAGTCTGMFLCVLIAFYPFVRGKNIQLSFCRPRFNVKIIREIIACGSPSFLNNIAGRITSILMNWVLLRLGGENAVSVYGILMFADGFIQPLLYGMCDSLQPAVGFNWGAGNYSRVAAIEKRCFAASAILSVASAAVIFIFPRQVTNLFASAQNEELIIMSVTALKLFSFTYVTRWFSFATQSFMTAVEKPVQASVISVSTALFFPVILIAVLWPLGLNGLWLNMTGTAVLAAVLAGIILIMFKRNLKKYTAV